MACLIGNIVGNNIYIVFAGTQLSNSSFLTLLNILKSIKTRRELHSIGRFFTAIAWFDYAESALILGSFIHNIRMFYDIMSWILGSYVYELVISGFWRNKSLMHEGIYILRYLLTRLLIR